MTPRPARYRSHAAALLVALGLSSLAILASPVALSTVTPTGASADVAINIDGTGFNLTAGSNQVTFTPAAGPAVTTAATRVTSGTSLMRLTVTVPGGLPTGQAAVQVRNTATGEIGNGVSIDVLSLTLPGVAFASPGTRVDVQVVGSSNSRFIAGNSRAVFGAGITVNSTTVQSATTLIANITIAATAATGPRSVGVTSTNQQAIAPNAFVVSPVAPANRNPSASAGGPYSGLAGAPIQFHGTGEDPDVGDTLAYGWVFGDGGTATGPSPAHTYAAAGAFTATLTVTDGHGGSASSGAAVTITTPVANQRPIVSAGSSQTITLLAAAALSGTATDDGLPTGSTVITTWTKLSGPGAVAFATPGALTTSASFDQPGSYVLRLTATDSLLSSTADVTVTVNPAPPVNQKPTVTAGSDQTITLPAVAALSGTATDDGLPTDSTVISTWTKLSGPGAVAFATPGALTTSASFDQPGSYVLRLTATDSLLSSTADVTVTVNPAPPVNQKPTVTAGPDQTITLPSAAALSGTVTDDGLPTGSTLSTTWTKLSGPGAVAFATPGALATSASFDQPGTYVLRLTATDSLLSSTADVTVTVNPAPPANQKPTVTAGPDQTITLPAAAALSGTATDDGLPTGSTVITAWTKLSGPGAVAFATPGALATSASFDQPGTYVLRLTATDSLLANSVDVTITVAPVGNHKPVANAGAAQVGDAGLGVTFDGSGSADPDGDTLTYAWSFGDSTTSTDGKPFHVYAVAGAFTVTLIVTDSHGAVSEPALTTATIGAAADRAPPVVTLSGPKEALPGAQVTMTGTATDNIGVQSIIVNINGAQPLEVPGSPFQRVIAIPDLVAPGSTVTVSATARDAAGNVGTASATVTVVAEPDTEKPVAHVRAPLHASPGTVLQITATASDNVGVASVILAADATTVGSLTAPPFEATYVIPAAAVVGSTVTVSAQATDGAGNRGTSTASIEIVGTPDDVPPTISLTAPATAQAGESVPVSAVAADLGGVASVRFFADGVRIATIIDAPYGTLLVVPASAAPGDHVHVEARAIDFSGLQAIATRDVVIVTTGQGVLVGEVYDDNTGLPLEGATAALVGKDARGLAYTQVTLSDTHGRYVIHAPEGNGIVQVAKAGWSALDRPALIKPDTAIELVDARITAAAAGAPIDALAGGTVTGDRVIFLEAWQREVSAAEDPSVGTTTGPNVTLTIPPGSLSANSTVTLTPLSRQSLPGLLPPGWTPIDILDIGPHGLAFASAASVSSPNALNLKAGTPVTFTAWDEQARAWRALDSTTLAQAKAVLTGVVSGTGQYAWVVADTSPSVPPQPAAGELLGGVAAVLLPTTATAVVNPQPRILFYKPGVKSVVRGTVSTPGALQPSGTIIRSRITEAYQFYTSAELHLEPFEQDLVLYQIPGGATPVMAAGYPVSPSLTFEPLSLEKGVITVEVRAPEEAVHEVVLIGTGGGSISVPSGERLDVAAGSTPLTLPVEIRALSAAELGVALPPGFELAGAAAISFASALTAPATFSTARPLQATDTDLFLLTRLQEVGGQTRYVLVGVGRILNDRLVSERTLAGTDAIFEGVQVPGRYVFLRPASPVAFAAGTVTGAAGTGFPGALVSSSTLPTVSVSRTGGGYIAGIAVGDVTLTALDVQKTDTVSALATTSVARQVVALNLPLVARPPTVTSVSPVNGAINIALGDPIVIHFSSPIDPATATLQTIQLTSSAGLVLGTLALTSNSTAATFRPLAALQPNTAYTVVVTNAVKDPFGRALPASFTAAFTSLDTVAPPPPAAGSLSATIPGTDGKTTITATQGTAGAHDTVVIRNVTRGTITPVVLDPNGGFVALVVAGVGDKLQLLITDAAGNTTAAPAPRFHRENANGSISEAIGSEGGRILGPGCVPEADGTPTGPACVVIDVPTGAFAGGTIITVRPVAESEFPVQLTFEQKVFFNYTGGFQLDLGGAAPSTYLNVSIAARPDDTLVDRWVVGQVATVGGLSVLNVADTARLIERRIATSSPPCPGVTGSGVYGFLKSARPLGVTFTQMASSDEFTNALVAVAEALTQLENGSPFQLPYQTSIDAAFASALGTIPKQVCLPVLSGRVTIGANRSVVPIPAPLLSAADEEVVVTNHAAGRETSAHLYPPFDTSVSVDGSDADPISVEVHSRVFVNGALVDATRTLDAAQCTAHSLAADCLKLRPRSFVVVEIPQSQFQLGDQSILVQNARTRARATLAFVGGRRFSTVKMIVEGSAADTYTAQVIQPGGASRQVAPLPPVAYPLGSGALLVRGIPGAIDPTRAEILVYNLNRAAGEPGLDPQAGVKRVVLQTRHLGAVVRTDTILDSAANDIDRVVTGGFLVALNASLTDTFTVHVEYENGTVDDSNLPLFRITVSNAS
ncbi:MAG: hypothetical protein V7647_1178, partial [Acidobacteriota bacterium]